MLTKHVDTANALQATQAQVIEVKHDRQNVSKRFSELQTEKTTVDTSLREERLKSENLQKENESLKANLQAKKEAEAQAAQAAAVQTEPVQATAPAVSVTGNKQSWLAASGIPQSEWSYVDYIVTKESGWNPNAVNASSGACGLGQQLPCGKWAGAWNDPVAALRAMDGYAKGRYGSWAGAYSAWISKNWW